jgi:hypothetical protein
MNQWRTKKRRGTKESPFKHLWPEIADMPCLRHWPDRSKSFCPETSEVIIWICGQFECDHIVADKIFQSARSKKIVIFDQTTKVWFGQKGGQP